MRTARMVCEHSRDWLKQWRQYVNHGTSKRSSALVPAAGAAAGAALGSTAAAVTAVAGGGGAGGSVAVTAGGGAPARPPPLPVAMMGVLCPCHPQDPRLRVRPPRVVAKRNKFSVADPESEPLAVIDEQDWQLLSTFYPYVPISNDAAAAAATTITIDCTPPAEQAGTSPGAAVTEPHPTAVTGVTAILLAPDYHMQPARNYAEMDAGEEMEVDEGGEDEAGAGAGASSRAAKRASTARTSKQQQPPSSPPQQKQRGRGRGKAAGGECVDLVSGADHAGQPPSSAPAVPSLSGDVEIVEGAGAGAAAAASNGNIRSTRSRAMAPAGAPAAPGASKGASGAQQQQQQQQQQQPKDVVDMSNGENGEAAGDSRQLSHAAAGTSTDFPADAAASLPGGAPAAAGPVSSIEWMTFPQVCEEYLRAEAARARSAQLTYVGAEVMVELVTAEELLTTGTTAGAAAAAGRKSKRARKGRCPLLVDSTTTLRQLKMKVLEALGLHPDNADVYVRGGKLEDDEKTLAEHEVFPEEEIRVVDAGRCDNDDLTGLFGAAGGAGKRRAIEHGFKNTALLSGGGAPAAGGAVATEPAAGTPEPGAAGQ